MVQEMWEAALVFNANGKKMKSFLIDCVGELENVKSKAYLNTEEVT